MKSSLVKWDDPGERRAGRQGESEEPDSREAAAEDNIFLSLSPERAKVLLIVAARTSSFTMVTVVVVMLGALLAAGSGLAGASGAIAAGWLAVHQVPLVIGKTSVGVLPLLPTALVMWLAARDCARAVEPKSTRVDLGWIVGAALSGPLLITAVCLAVAEDASAVVALQPPNTLAAFGWVGGLHLLAAAAAIVWKRPRLITPHLPEWVLPGAQVAMRAVQRLLLAGAVLTLISFLAHWSRIGDTYRAAGNIAGVLGLTLLSLAYLPNVVIDATSLLVGADIHIGSGALSVFSVAGAPVPSLPILAAVPAGPAAAWWPVLLLVPAVVGGLCGWEAAKSSADEPRRPWSTLTAAGISALTLAVLARLAGGAAGSFGDLGPQVPLVAGFAFVWLAAAGYLGLLASRWFFVAPAVPDAEDDYVDDYDDYPDDADYDPAEDDYADDDYESVADDYVDDEYYVDPDAYSGSDVVDGEVIEEPLALSSVRDAAAQATDENGDILDAEVVEADLPDNHEMDGR
ncbi:DUF6350 family protein [Nocardia transvalensis]|uniref:cell division protein PerM n=1 Tax=Nocardia transvalensis TaxID=37333 RepID=UPI001895901C|nr:DUF6350 family protein [Nocardia transvalensis]MBF6330564.1 hypothetical protein [Nocardia transvalensis]